MTTSDNVCWFSGEAMTPWLEVPGDWRAPQARPGPFRLYRAEQSEFGWVYPRPSFDEVAAYYTFDGYYTHDEGGAVHADTLDRALRKLAWTFDASIETDVAWARTTFGSARSRILDVGAGDGAFAATVRDAGHELVCVEPDPVCRERIAAKGLRAFAGTAEELPDVPDELPDELRKESMFDAVTLLHVLEHTRDPAGALRSAFARVRPGGLLVVEVPNNQCVGHERLAFTWAFFDVPRHLSFFTATSLRRAVEHAGFVFVKQEMRGFTRQYLPEWLEEEQRIHDALAATGATLLPQRSTRRAAWSQLARALRLPDERRYDSVRIIARRP